MKLFLRFLFLAVLIMNCTESFSKNIFNRGILILNQNDTLKGYIDLNTDSKLFVKCRFKRSENSPETIYSSKEIKAILLDKQLKKYIPGIHPVELREVLYEVICEGKVNLYYLETAKSANFYIQKSNDSKIHSLPYERTERYVDNGYTKRMKVLETTYHIDTLKMVMEDSPALFDEIEKIKKPEKKDLTNIVTKYNSGKPNTSDAIEKSIHISELEQLKKGKLNLYLNVDSASNNHFYIQQQSSEKLVELPFKKLGNTKINGLVINSYTSSTTSHMDTLKKYMADAKPLFPSIDQIEEPTKKKLQKLVDEYNAYIDEETYLKKHTIKRLPLNIDIIPGFTIVNSSEPYFRAGAQFDIGFINSNKHLFIKSGILIYKSFSPTALLYYQLPETLPIYDRATTLKIPIQFEYRFSEKTLQPCIAIGYNFYSYLENTPNNKTLFPVFTPGLNIYLSSRLACRLNVEFEFNSDKHITYIPQNYYCTNLFCGLQVKL